MVKVTDKDYYMDRWLSQNLDLMIEREKKGWDNFLIMDGTPGCGKSTFSWQIGYYLAHKTGKAFGVDNIFFEADKLIKYFYEKRNRIIIWDESAAEGMAVDWQNKNQQKLVKLLFMARKYGHIIIFVIPEIRKLQGVFAGSRSLCLIRVFSPNAMDRGYFRFYNARKKVTIYNEERAGKFWHKTVPDFWGRFANPKNFDPLLDEVEYEKKKDAAIKMIDDDKGGKKEKFTRDQRSYLSLLKWLRKTKKMSLVEIGSIIDQESSHLGKAYKSLELLEKKTAE